MVCLALWFHSLLWFQDDWKPRRDQWSNFSNEQRWPAGRKSFIAANFTIEIKFKNGAIRRRPSICDHFNSMSRCNWNGRRNCYKKSNKKMKRGMIRRRKKKSKILAMCRVSMMKRLKEIKGSFSSPCVSYNNRLAPSTKARHSPEPLKSLIRNFSFLF